MDFFITLLIHHCGRNRSQEKHDVTDSLSYAVALKKGGCLNLVNVVNTVIRSKNIPHVFLHIMSYY